MDCHSRTRVCCSSEMRSIGWIKYTLCETYGNYLFFDSFRVTFVHAFTNILIFFLFTVHNPPRRIPGCRTLAEYFKYSTEHKTFWNVRKKKQTKPFARIFYHVTLYHVQLTKPLISNVIIISCRCIRLTVIERRSL